MQSKFSLIWDCSNLNIEDNKRQKIFTFYYNKNGCSYLFKGFFKKVLSFAQNNIKGVILRFDITYSFLEKLFLSIGNNIQVISIQKTTSKIACHHYVIGAQFHRKTFEHYTLLYFFRNSMSRIDSIQNILKGLILLFCPNSAKSM